MGISDYDIDIKDKDFRIAELINETAYEQMAARKLQIQVLELCEEVSRLNLHIQTLELALQTETDELYLAREALRREMK